MGLPTFGATNVVYSEVNANTLPSAPQDLALQVKSLINVTSSSDNLQERLSSSDHEEITFGFSTPSV